MIKYKYTVGEVSSTLECETMEQLIQYLKANESEVVNVGERMTATEVNERINSFNKAFANRMNQVNNAPNYID